MQYFKNGKGSVVFGLDSHFFTINEISKILKIHRTTVSRLLDRGELSYVQIGSSKRIPRNSLDKFIENGIAKKEQRSL